MAVSVTYGFLARVTETLDTGVAGAPNPAIVFSAYDEAATLNGTSVPPVTENSQFLATLVAGALTINLAALVGANGTIDGTGLRVQILRVQNLGANDMVFSEGASNGIALKCLPFTVPAGGISQFLLNDASPDIAAGDRTIDIAGTLVETAEVTIILG